MVYVRLDDEWTDGEGVTHPAGEMVDVDAATLAALQAEGIVGGESADWAGPVGSAGSVGAGVPDPPDKGAAVGWGRPPGPENDEDEW